jgi:hypothetical protein
VKIWVGDEEVNHFQIAVPHKKTCQEVIEVIGVIIVTTSMIETIETIEIGTEAENEKTVAMIIIKTIIEELKRKVKVAIYPTIDLMHLCHVEQVKKIMPDQM